MTYIGRHGFVIKPFIEIFSDSESIEEQKCTSKLKCEDDIRLCVCISNVTCSSAAVNNINSAHENNPTYSENHGTRGNDQMT